MTTTKLKRFSIFRISAIIFQEKIISGLILNQKQMMCLTNHSSFFHTKLNIFKRITIV